MIHRAHFPRDSAPFLVHIRARKCCHAIRHIHPHPKISATVLTKKDSIYRSPIKMRILYSSPFQPEASGILFEFLLIRFVDYTLRVSILAFRYEERGTSI